MQKPVTHQMIGHSPQHHAWSFHRSAPFAQQHMMTAVDYGFVVNEQRPLTHSVQRIRQNKVFVLNRKEKGRPMEPF